MNDWRQAADELLTACRDTFGIPVIYIPTGGSSIAIVAIFDDHAEFISIDAVGVPVSTTKTVLDVRVADLPGDPLEGDGVRVETVDYRVTDVLKDGSGGARLILNRT